MLTRHANKGHSPNLSPEKTIARISGKIQRKNISDNSKWTEGYLKKGKTPKDVTIYC